MTKKICVEVRYGRKTEKVACITKIKFHCRKTHFKPFYSPHPLFEYIHPTISKYSNFTRFLKVDFSPFSPFLPDLPFGK